MYPGIALSRANNQTITDKVINDKNVNDNGTFAEVKQQIILFTFTEVFELIQVPVQTYLLTVISSDPSILHNIKASNPIKFCILINVFQFLAMVNSVLWVNGSFIEFNIIEHLPWTYVLYGDTWKSLAQFTLPILLFFRFHSVHMIIEMYVHYSWHSSKKSQ